jgi:hypothetical protein
MSGADKRNTNNFSRRNSNIESLMLKVTPQGVKTTQNGNLSFMNPLNNISDIDHVLSDSRLDAHL